MSILSLEMVVDVPQSSLARRHNQLLWRIMRQYAVVTEPVEIGPVRFEFTRAADPNRVLDEVALEEDRREKATGQRKREDELHLPYWAELWDSSLGLAHFVVEQWAHCGAATSAIATLARGAVRSAAPVHAMDLGCGMGLAGVAAARLGMHILFADLEPPALLFAQLNCMPDADRCRVRKVNWQADRLEERFDVILGADIVYDRSQWPFLDTFFQNHLKPGAAVVLGEPGRSSGEEFEPWAMARGWNVTRFSQQIPNRDSPIHLLELTRR